MKHIIGFSGGIDSQAAANWVLDRFPAQDVILLNSDAGGNEHPLTTEFLRWFSDNVHPVIFLRATWADIYTTDQKDMRVALRRGREKSIAAGHDPDEPIQFVDLAILKGRWPSRMAQFCTSKLKVFPSLRWIVANIEGDLVRYSGVRRDESSNRKDTPEAEWDDSFGCEIRHPIVAWTKERCFADAAGRGQKVNELYRLGFSRVGCAPCINSSRADIANWAKRFPAMIHKVRDWEKRSGRTFYAPMVPGKEINWIDEVVDWANCVRGGRQFALEVLLAPATCESKYGLCE